MSLFYPIVFGITCVFACYSGATIAVKKFIGYKKDKNLVKNITIMIDDKGETVLRINNAKHNNPIIGSLPIIATTTLFAGFGLISFRNAVSGDGPIFQFWFIWFAEIFFKTLLPLLVIICRESFCSFIRRFFKIGVDRNAITTSWISKSSDCFRNSVTTNLWIFSTKMSVVVPALTVNKNE